MSHFYERILEDISEISYDWAHFAYAKAEGVALEAKLNPRLGSLGQWELSNSCPPSPSSLPSGLLYPLLGCHNA